MKILVANRGEIAVRIIRAAEQLNMHTVAVYADDDAQALHVRRADHAVALGANGPAAYLDIDAIVGIAREQGVDAIHPGYGFISESAAFARACADAGIAFIGPSPEVLDTFGDKVSARAAAVAAGLSVAPGLPAPVSLVDAERFFAEHGPVMVKAVSGGGGRGMREVHEAEELPDAFSRCASEAQAAFGDGSLYLEKLLPRTRHIEVQIVADAAGTVSHLGERDCSIQRRHQKLIEIAPSPALAEPVRARIIEAAVTLARHVGYRGVGTVEFLVHDEQFWFIEVNPRLQVEHTVTEEVTGVDLVATQLRILAGHTLAQLGLAEPPTPRGTSLQCRVNAETIHTDGTVHPSAGTLTVFAAPSGPGIRVDTAAYPGWTLSPRYDSLLAKVVATGEDLRAAAARAARALTEFAIAGVDSNRPLLHAILSEEDFLSSHADTGYLDEHLAELLSAPPLPDPAAELAAVAVPEPVRAEPVAPDGGRILRAPMAGVIIERASAGDVALATDAAILVLEAMKMEHVIRAEEPLRIVETLVEPGELVDAGAALLVLMPADGAVAASTPTAQAEDWSAEVAELARREAFAEEMGGPDKIARQHQSGRLTARERIGALADEGSFQEIGKLAGFAQRDERGAAVRVQPTNFLAGTARLGDRKVVLGVDDFTVRGGSGDAAIHAKQIWLEQYALQARMPMVRLLDGQSGGGSVKMAMDAGYTYVPFNPAWDAITRSLSEIPVVSAALGPTVGLGAARLVMSHLAVLVEEVGQLFTAGPPLVRSATGEDLSKEELGGAAVHRGTGSVERIVGSEQEAFEVIRRFLSYLPSSTYELPPILPGVDPVHRREQSLLSAIPRSPRATYRITPILEAIFDEGSVFRYAEYGGGTVTALARLNGHPVGVIAADPVAGATLSAEGALAVTRLVDLCETFHLPIVSLTDQAGMTIGLTAERRATIRHGARALTAVYQARSPQAELILRRVYGVGGAGIINRHRAQRSWAWPSGDWGSLPSQGGVEAAFGAQIAAADDPAAEAERLRRELVQLGSPFRTAEKFGIQDLIDPRESRPLLCEWVEDAYRLIPPLLGPPSFGTRP